MLGKAAKGAHTPAPPANAAVDLPSARSPRPWRAHALRRAAILLVSITCHLLQTAFTSALPWHWRSRKPLPADTLPSLAHCRRAALPAGQQHVPSYANGRYHCMVSHLTKPPLPAPSLPGALHCTTLCTGQASCSSCWSAGCRSGGCGPGPSWACGLWPSTSRTCGCTLYTPRAQRRRSEGGGGQRQAKRGHARPRPAPVPPATSKVQLGRRSGRAKAEPACMAPHTRSRVRPPLRGPEAVAHKRAAAQAQFARKPALRGHHGAP